jgi:hypothetical protein
MQSEVGVVELRKGAAPERTLHPDLLVLGSGMGGVSAALEARRAGLEVLLADAAPQLGGQAVGAMVGTLCGLYSNGPRRRQVVHGIADEILADLSASGDLQRLDDRRNTTIFQYRVPALMRWVEDAVLREGIGTLLGAVLAGAEVAGGRIAEARFATRYGPVGVRPQAAIDASGDAALAYEAGLAVFTASAPVYGTLMITLEGVAEAELDREALLARLKEKGAQYGLVRFDGFVFSFPAAGETLVNLTHLQTPLEPLAASRAVAEGRAQADRVLEFLRREFPRNFGAARVKAYGLPGIRQTRMIAGLHRLGGDEVRQGVRFADAIACGSWPIELHLAPERVHWEEFGDDHLHWVPLGSLVAREAANLAACGRCISADPVALAAVRVIGTCIATGAAAAHLVAQAAGGDLRRVPAARVQSRVRANLGGV